MEEVSGGPWQVCSLFIDRAVHLLLKQRWHGAAGLVASAGSYCSNPSDLRH